MKKNFYIVTLIIFIFFFSICHARSESIWKVVCDSELPKNVFVKTHFCWTIDEHYELQSTDSFIEIKFFLKDKGKDTFTLKITDRASTFRISVTGLDFPLLTPPDYNDGEFANVKMNIFVNEKLTIFNSAIWWNQDDINYYDIGKFLVPGENIILINLNPRSKVRYDIKEIELLKNIKEFPEYTF